MSGGAGTVFVYMVSARVDGEDDTLDHQHQLQPMDFGGNMLHESNPIKDKLDEHDSPSVIVLETAPITLSSTTAHAPPTNPTDADTPTTTNSVTVNTAASSGLFPDRIRVLVMLQKYGGVLGGDRGVMGSVPAVPVFPKPLGEGFKSSCYLALVKGGEGEGAGRQRELNAMDQDQGNDDGNDEESDEESDEEDGEDEEDEEEIPAPYVIEKLHMIGARLFNRHQVGPVRTLSVLHVVSSLDSPQQPSPMSPLSLSTSASSSPTSANAPSVPKSSPSSPSESQPSLRYWIHEMYLSLQSSYFRDLFAQYHAIDVLRSGNVTSSPSASSTSSSAHPTGPK
ncbi:hypothetical protein HK102_004677, partial [Quaeritorhiza haematococci]